MTLDPVLPRTAWARIDLDALIGNLAAIRGALPAGVRVDPVVKADAYGHGAVMVARTLEAAGADGCCVATLDEALELRAAGIRLPILVLFPIPPELAPEAARRAIAITAGDLDLLARTIAVVDTAAAASRDAGRRTPRPLAIHLEIETGLGRGGVLPDDAAVAIDRIVASDGARLAGVWSHLATPGDPGVTDRQARRFAVAQDVLSDARVGITRRHLAASGGLLAATAPVHDAVRIGLAIYGLIPDALPVAATMSEAAAALRPVMSIHARPVRVADLPAGTGIGYDATFVTTRPSRIATLPIGYGDGWTRGYSNRAWALVRDACVPLVGTVAMDAVMADVTDVAGEPVGVDDEFVLLGRLGERSILAADLARARGSNSWEVVSAMARRLSRVYVRGGVTVAARTLRDR